MTSKLVVNTIESDTGISSVSFASSISMSSTSKFFFSAAGIDIGADTNINRPASGVLGFNINSSEKVRITSGGSVGIGTIPASGTTLDMDASGGGVLVLRRNSVSTSNKISLSHDGTNGTLDSTNAILFRAGGSEKLRIHSGGQVQIAGDSIASISHFADDLVIGESGSSAISGLTLCSTDSSGIRFHDTADMGEIEFDHGDNSLAVKANQILKFRTNNGERLRITADGDVAIGRDSAQANYAAGTDTTKLAVAKDAAGSGYHEMAHFAAGSDANDTGSIVRIGHFSNDRGFYIKAGRGTGDNAKAIFGLRTSSAADQDAMTILQGGQLVVGGDTNIGHPNMDDIIIGDASGSRGITIASGTSNYGSVAFGDSTDGSGSDRYEGLIEYYHNDDSLTFYTAHTAKFKILSTSNGGALETASKTITGGNNLAIQNFKVKGVWSGASSIGKSIELISGYDSSVKMAAVGYNLTDVNLGSTYGGDLTFHTQPLYSSPTTPLPVRMRISSSGHVTKPETPCFIVRHTSAEVYNGGSYIDGPWSSTLNRGSHFNVSTGIFTTPVSGLYQVNMMMNNDYNSSSRPGNFQIRVNNSLYAGIQFDPLDSHGGWFTHTLCGTLNLSRNDTVRLYTGNAARVDNSNWNHWSMYLIG